MLECKKQWLVALLQTLLHLPVAIVSTAFYHFQTRYLAFFMQQMEQHLNL